jgi:C4-dicarboxylate-specific signal transduction histidine kinase
MGIVQMTKNTLIRRQLKKSGIDSLEDLDSEKFLKFLNLVESSYEEYEKSVRLAEHSLDIASAEMRETLETNRKQAQQLVRQSRFASMGEMISMIAHQWRQPLNALAMTLNDMTFKVLFGRCTSENVLGSLDRASGYIRHMSDTIEDFKNFFKIDKKSTWTSFKKMVEDVNAIVAPSLEKHRIRLDFHLEPSQTFHTYENELKQVILNLLKNAEDILVEREVSNPVITLTSFSSNGFYGLRVEDNGGGIDPAIKERIFEPYFSTKEQKNGTGIGLYMSKIIVEDHCQGRLFVENGKAGAIFTIEVKSL